MQYQGKEYQLLDGDDRLFNLSYTVRQLPTVNQLIGYVERLIADPTTPDYLQFAGLWRDDDNLLALNDGRVGAVIIGVPGVKIEIPVDFCLDLGGLYFINGEESAHADFTDEEIKLFDDLYEEFCLKYASYTETEAYLSDMYRIFYFVTPEQALHNLTRYKRIVDGYEKDYANFFNELQTSEDKLTNW